jgi:predicted RND superfamily exporter protein
MNSSKYVDKIEPIEDWHYEFINSVSAPASSWNSYLDSNLQFTQRSDYYAALHDWYAAGTGVRYRTRMKWKDPACANDTVVSGETRVWNSCNPSLGLTASRFGLTLKLEFTDVGQTRYDTMTAMRSEVGAVFKDFGGSSNFPYSFEFLYWEEVGIIDKELVNNLMICGLVVLVIVGLMIPHPRIAIWVAFSISLSVVNLIGFMYWWGVTISGVSTVYILISVGLAVDYSAHIAHMFVVSAGTSQQRAIKAIERIGPSVFNGIVSTLLAVVVIGTSKSYVFIVFFKALFLTVLLGGSHGLIWLPVVLSLAGGDKVERKEDGDAPVKTKKSAVVDSSPEVEMTDKATK